MAIRKAFPEAIVVFLHQSIIDKTNRKGVTDLNFPIQNSLIPSCNRFMHADRLFSEHQHHQVPMMFERTGAKTPTSL
jgi:hypothetical protein